MPDRTLSSAFGAISRNPVKGMPIKTYASQAPEAVERTLAHRVAAFRLLLLTAAVALLANAPAFGQPTTRVRGAVTAIVDGSVTVKQRDGRTFTLKTDPTTTYADVVPSSLDSIKVNDYVGAAIKGPLNDSVAVEIVLVPESMRAGRKGFYAWDPLPDTSGIDTSGTTAPGMTNGLVSSVPLRRSSSRTPA